MNKRKAIGTSNIVAFVVVAIIIVGAIGAAILASRPGGLSPTTPKSSTMSSTRNTLSTSSAVYQVIESNLTLHGQTATIPCVNFGFTCPPASNASLPQVELVRYGSTYFYLHNQTVPTGVIVQVPLNATYDVWFTNSTVFCVTPVYPQNRTCPTSPYEETTITIPIPSASTPDSSNGLSLSLSLSTNSTGMLNVVLVELNTLDQTNNVTVAHEWPTGSNVNLSLWTAGCGPVSPIGYEVLQGNYGENNYTMGTALFLDLQAPIQCPVSGSSPPNYLIFKPFGNVSTSGAWSGFWIGTHDLYYGNPCPDLNQSDYCPLAFVPFAAGTFTVVACDEWGQVVMLHFTVQG